MQQNQAYDLPIRIFHWLFAGLFISAFIVAKNVDDDSIVFVYHMIAGMLLVFSVFLRLIWGLVGSPTARFDAFQLSPRDLFSYFKGVFSSKTTRYWGHNPASSYAAVFMFLLAVALGFSGFMMTAHINKHFFEEVHEISANVFFLTAIAHIFGVILHQFKHRDGMITSMIDGKKQEIPGEQMEIKNHGLVAAVFVAIMAVAGFTLNSGLDPQTGKLSLMGFSLSLGEDENQHSDKSESPGLQQGDDENGDDKNEDHEHD